MAVNKKLRLGRGLDGLISNGARCEEKVAQGGREAGGGICELPLNRIVPNEKQARKNFDSASIHELAHSIQREGLLQPIIVCPMDGEQFSIVAGERRFRAMQFLGMEKFSLKLSTAMSGTVPLFPSSKICSGFTQEQIAQRVGKARATIANSMRLLNLDEKILSHLALGKITVGHAKVLLGVDDPSLRIELLEKILSGDLNVRQTERQANILKSGKPVPMPSTPRELSESLMKIEKQIAQQLAANVSLQHSSTHGKIIIEYRGEQELLRIIQSMGIE
jgi:ParB family chromosome partitioning protein